MTIEEMFNKLMNEIQETKKVLTSRMDKLDSRMDKLDSRMDKIEITLEQEIQKDIQLLVEGHKTLIDNIERSSKASSTAEINEYRIQLLERDIKRLKKEYNMN